ncbi:TPA: TonB-dependent receptor [Burkholderia cenocepacia]|nr:TonB-dependent receptor [Burkholderia cenocepacia]HDR9888546.1 TonB-dependent receptor [Burkholderia cenocepacia]
MAIGKKVRKHLRRFGKGVRVQYVLAGGVLVVSSGVVAQTATINLPSQPLSTALATLARQGHADILAADALVANRTAPGVSGQLTVREALDQLLKDSGLKVELRDGAYVVVKSPPSPPKPLNETKVGIDAVLPTIAVTDSASADEGFVAESTSTATRTDTSIALTAQSIHVLTQDLLRSKQTQSVSDALSQISGVTGSISETVSNISIRGFTAQIRNNGSPQIGGSAILVPMAGVEKIEVLQGADSIVAGAMDPGGVVNVVTKQPTAIPVHEITLQTGSFGDWLGAIDLGGPLTQDKRLTYRFVLSAERAGQTSSGFDNPRTFYVAPSLDWKSGATELTFGYQHNVVAAPGLATAVLQSNGPAPYEFHSFPWAQKAGLTRVDQVSMDWKQGLGSIWQFESKSLYSAIKNGDPNYVRESTSFGDLSNVVYSLPAVGGSSLFGWDTDNHLQGKFRTGPIEQTVLAGVDYQVSWRESISQDTGSFVGPFPPPPAWFVSPPVTGVEVANTALSDTDSEKSYFSNLYLQDQLTWARLHVLASIAHGTSWVHGKVSQSAWTPNLGLVYQLTDSVAVYANVMRSFHPQPGVRLLGGGLAPPKSGRSVEAGVKLSLLDDRLSVTADVFRAAIYNVAQEIPDNPDFHTLLSGQVTRGVELNAEGSLLPGLNLTAGYTYINVQSSSAETDVPHNMANLWLSYDLQGERWQGWGAGLGITARGACVVRTDAIDSRLPGQAQTDLSVWYHAKRWSSQFAIKNLSNRRLYVSSTYGDLAFLQPGRLVYLTSRYDF